MRASAADEVVQGASQQGQNNSYRGSGTDQPSITTLQHKVNTLETEGYGQLGRIMFKMVQIFVTQEMAIKLSVPMGQWKDFNPNDYTGEYEPKVTLETTQKTLQVEEGQKYMQVHKPSPSLRT